MRESHQKGCLVLGNICIFTRALRLQVVSRHPLIPPWAIDILTRACWVNQPILLTSGQRPNSGSGEDNFLPTKYLETLIGPMLMHPCLVVEAGSRLNVATASPTCPDMATASSFGGTRILLIPLLCTALNYLHCNFNNTALHCTELSTLQFQFHCSALH
jgi:hypothetical protein